MKGMGFEHQRNVPPSPGRIGFLPSAFRTAFVCGFAILAALFASCAGPALAPIDFKFPTRPIEFPRDLAAHEWAQSEWWYYSGHLKSPDGGAYGFELAFFRRRTELDRYRGLSLSRLGRTGYMAHFSVIDEHSGRYLSAGIGTLRARRARFSYDRYALALDEWTAGGDEKSHHIKARTKSLAIDLVLEPLKPLAKFGRDGIVTKEQGVANYYISFPRMTVRGRLVMNGKSEAVDGLGWFDHEFGFIGLTAVNGWDWFGIQLEDKTEYMVYALRRADGSLESLSRACRIDQAGRIEELPLGDIELRILKTWRSPRTKAVYPAGWRIGVPRWNLNLVLTPKAADQEFRNLGISYWEGTCEARGTPADGRAYVELVGYAKSRILDMTKLR